MLSVLLDMIVCYHKHVEKIPYGLYCNDCERKIMTWSIGKPRFHD